MTVRVLLVNDDEQIRMGLELILESDFAINVVGQAANGGEANSAAEEIKPTSLSWTSKYPLWAAWKHGIKATRRIVEKYVGGEGPQILILNTLEQDDFFAQAESARASGILLKHMPANALIAPVKEVAPPAIMPTDH